MSAAEIAGLSPEKLAEILDAWYKSYARFSRIEEDTFLALRNRLIPLTPGEPVQFQEFARRRWLNGTLEGPVGNPDDPLRAGDVIVIRDHHSPATDGRVSVFLSSVRRRPGPQRLTSQKSTRTGETA